MRAEANDVRGFQSAMAPAAARSKPLVLAAAAFGWLVGPLMLERDWDPTDAVITLRADMTIDVEPRLGEIAAPTLIISGEWDPSYPPHLTAELERRIPHARRIVYRRTGHGVVLKRRFARDLAEFLGAGRRTSNA
jgi:pimeloyl-ACP methyl ester carboxylesterase